MTQFRLRTLLLAWVLICAGLGVWRWFFIVPETLDIDMRPRGPSVLSMRDAIAEERVDILGGCLKAWPALVHERLPDGDTLLHVAIERHNSEAVAVLVASGADPYETGADGKNCLELAHDLGNGDVVALLEHSVRRLGK